MKFDKKEKIDYEKVLNFIGFKKLDSFDKKTMTMLLQKGPLSLFYKNYPNTIKDSTIVATDFQVIYFLTEIFKYQLETSTKCDKLIDQNSKVIEQNNQIIELLQKIANKYSKKIEMRIIYDSNVQRW